MTKILPLILSIVILCTTCCTPAPDANQRYVQDFLREKGVNTSCEWVDSREGLRVMSATHAFVILADSVYSPVLGGNRILAYSTTHPWKNDVSVKAILDYYEDMLATALRSKTTYRQMTGKEYPPILHTAWGQDAPYNNLCPQPQGKPVKAGCLPVAVAQLVAHHVPEQRKDSVALIAATGSLLRARYGLDNTTAGTHRVKNVLQDRYGFAASCRLRKDLNNGQLLQLAERNLQAGNVLLLSNRDHAFLADGKAQDYLHLNLGIGGPCNGYYRILCAADDQWERLFATTIFTDIRQGRELSVHVQVKQPGTLQTLLGDSAMHVTQLQVSGRLNGQDVALIRRMAGAVDSTTAPTGSLTQLKMHQVQFVAGDEYHIEDAVKMKFVIKRQKEVYDFSQLSENRWKSFCAKGFDQTADYHVKHEDGTYRIHFLLSAHPNTTYLFMDCVNLKSTPQQL